MPSGQSVQTTRRGEFRAIHRALSRNRPLRKRTPVVFCEGDSWFSTPLSMNLLDWLVFPSPQNEERGVPIVGAGGLFFRAEESGDLATQMFSGSALRDIMQWYGGFDFDIALLSAGGNDFVDRFLARTFANRRAMSVDQAFETVVQTGRYAEVFAAYERALSKMVQLHPRTPIVAHTYAYPVKLGVPADLTVANLGVAALMKRNAGPWIGPQMARALPDVDDQRAFARRLIDGFVERVLDPLAGDARFRRAFRYVDLREEVPLARDWFDEMHPTGATFNRLSRPFAAEINALFTLR
ncbi:hypothetical protein [Cognatilysobacter tabacisoli]|uniref:hypothetical protein n=1 Tax=Cognatilysobacter tabacisoli TaxID=2315424 RepID=UPI000E6B1ADF|nr:hypothetical protein [Lysobacter tabacisoli]